MTSVGGEAERRRHGRHTPLDGAEDGGLERLGETGVESAGLGLLALERLEVVEAALAGDLALELLEPVEGHAGGVGSAGGGQAAW